MLTFKPMKSLLRLVILFIACISFTACKKNYVCYCKSYGSGQVVEFNTDGKMTRGKALKYCNSHNGYAAAGYTCGVE